MRKAAQKLLNGFDISHHPMTKFSTEEKSHINDRYFLDSSDRISFFLEEKAVGADGKLTVTADRAVNKIGHALHKFDPVFKQMSIKPEIAGILRSLHYKDPIILQSMLIFKQPFVGGKGLYFLHTTQRLLTILAFSDAPSRFNVSIHRSTVCTGILVPFGGGNGGKWMFVVHTWQPQDLSNSAATGAEPRVFPRRQ